MLEDFYAQYSSPKNIWRCHIRQDP